MTHTNAPPIHTQPYTHKHTRNHTHTTKTRKPKTKDAHGGYTKLKADMKKTGLSLKGLDLSKPLIQGTTSEVSLKNQILIVVADVLLNYLI